MSRLLLYLLLIIGGVFVFPTTVSAHLESTSGTITGSYGLQPDVSNPEAGKEYTLEFAFTDSLGQFQLDTCTCTVTISHNAPSPYQQTIQKSGNTSDPNNAEISYQFPSEGRYTITVNGKPNNAGQFEPFSLTWQTVVSGSTLDTTSTLAPEQRFSKSEADNKIYLGLILLLTVIIVYVAVIRFRKQKKKI